MKKMFVTVLAVLYVGCACARAQGYVGIPPPPFLDGTNTMEQGVWDKIPNGPDTLYAERIRTLSKLAGTLKKDSLGGVSYIKVWLKTYVDSTGKIVSFEYIVKEPATQQASEYFARTLVLFMKKYKSLPAPKGYSYCGSAVLEL